MKTKMRFAIFAFTFSTILTSSAFAQALPSEPIKGVGYDEAGNPVDDSMRSVVEQGPGRLFSRGGANQEPDLMAGLSSDEPPTGAEITREKIAQWGDPFTPPQLRVRCVKEAWGRLPWGRRWRTCVGHAYDTKTYQRELFLVVRGPDTNQLEAEAKAKVEDALKTCLVVSAGGAATAFYATPSPEPGARIAAAVAAAGESFKVCIGVKKTELAAYFAGVPGRYSVDFDVTGGWSKWSNE